MKLTFLLQLFVLGFFLEVALTSPLVARQIKTCESGRPVLCSITLGPPNVSPPVGAQCTGFKPANCRMNGYYTICDRVDPIEYPQCSLASATDFSGKFDCIYDFNDQSYQIGQIGLFGQIRSDCRFFCPRC
ncbi:212_t:CDS:1, partial [Cetraspora pellucida]